MTDQMTRIVVKGAGKYDGEYLFDSDRALNGREWNWIKRIAGYMPMTIAEGLAGDDPDLYAALTVISMCRDGRIDRTEGPRVAEVLAEIPLDTAGGIQFIFPTEEADDSPPALTGEHEPQSQNGSPEKTSSSGHSSPSPSENPAPTPPPTGTSGSDTSARPPAPTLSAR